MAKKIAFVVLTAILFFCSCKSKPSHADIEKKILLEYTCAETAKVNSLEIIKTSPTSSVFGLKGYEYLVSGEVEWPSGCTEFGPDYLRDIKKNLKIKRLFL